MTTTANPESSRSLEAPEQANETTPVTIEKTKSIRHLKNILVPVDFSATSLKSLQYAVPFARQFGAKITLLNVVRPPVYSPEGLYPGPLTPEQLHGTEKDLEFLRRTRIPEDVEVEIVARFGYACGEIPAIAKELRADLIITSTHGYSGVKHLVMGSTAEYMVRHAPCPVFVVRELEHDFV